MNSRLIKRIKKAPAKRREGLCKETLCTPSNGCASKISISCRQYGLTLFTEWSWNGKLNCSFGIIGAAKGHPPLRICQCIFPCCASLSHGDCLRSPRQGHYAAAKASFRGASSWGFFWKILCLLVTPCMLFKMMQGNFGHWTYFSQFINSVYIWLCAVLNSCLGLNAPWQADLSQKVTGKGLGLSHPVLITSLVTD